MKIGSPHGAIWRLLPLFMLVSPVSGCDQSPELRTESSAEVQALLQADTSDTSGMDLLGEVVAARLTSTGRELVVLDGYEPFIKVLDREGQLIRSFAREGPGPGELKRPWWLAVSDDSVIAVVSGNGVSEFSLEGTFLGSVPPLSRYVLGITRGCEGTRWMVMGPKHLSGPPGAQNSWLASIPRIAGSEVDAVTETVLYQDSVFPGGWTVRLNTAMASGGGRFAFFRADPERALFEGSCSTGEIDRVELDLGYAGPDKVRTGVGPDGRESRQVTMALGPRHKGLGVLSIGILIARGSWSEPTVLNVLGSPDSVVIDLPESAVSLEDARPRVGALFSMTRPWPRVVFVPESVLLEAFGMKGGS